MKMLSLIIPVYNECDSLEVLFKGIYDSCSTLAIPFEVIVVNDGSTDGSSACLQTLHTSYPAFQVITLQRNFGKSAALTAGFDHAKGDVLMTMDADLQDDPKEIPAFLAKLNEGFDAVTGWKKNRKDPLEKKIPSKLFNAVTSMFINLKLHDYNCGFKAFKRPVIENVSLYGDMHRYFLALAYKKGFKIAEIPVTHHERKFGKSKFGLERYLRGFIDLTTVVFLTTYTLRPMHFIGPVGFITLFSGLGMFLYLFFGRWLHGISIGNSPLLLVSTLCIGVGVQILIAGFIAELIVFTQAKRMPYVINAILKK